jgi:hypothetical protein
MGIGIALSTLMMVLSAHAQKLPFIVVNERKSCMNEFNWLVLEEERAVAGLMSRDDTEQFVEQCGHDAMKLSRLKRRMPNRASGVHPRRPLQRLKVGRHPDGTSFSSAHR